MMFLLAAGRAAVAVDSTLVVLSKEHVTCTAIVGMALYTCRSRGSGWTISTVDVL